MNMGEDKNEPKRCECRPFAPRRKRGMMVVGRRVPGESCGCERLIKRCAALPNKAVMMSAHHATRETPELRASVMLCSLTVPHRVTRAHTRSL